MKKIGAVLAPFLLTGCLGGGGSEGTQTTSTGPTGSTPDITPPNVTVPSKTPAQLISDRQIEQCRNLYPIEEHWNICDAFFKTYPEYAPKGLWMPSGQRRPKQHFFVPGLVDAVVDLGLNGEGVNLIIDDSWFSPHELYDTAYLTADSMRVTEVNNSRPEGDSVSARVFGWASVFLPIKDSHGTAVYSVATGQIGVAPSASTSLNAPTRFNDNNVELRVWDGEDNYELLPAGIMSASHTGLHLPANKWGSPAYSTSTTIGLLWDNKLNELQDYIARGGIYVTGTGNDDGLSLSEMGSLPVDWDDGCIGWGGTRFGYNTNPFEAKPIETLEPTCIAKPLHKALPDSMVYAGSFTMGTDEVSSFSNVPGIDPEVQARTIMAPGEQVTVAKTYGWDGFQKIYADTGTHKANGTSYSTPMVSGAVALVKQAKPELSYKEALQWVLDHADKSFAGYDPAKHGVGKLSLVGLTSSN